MSGYLAEIQKQNPESIVELYELDGNAIGMNSMYFHADLTAGPIYWQGIQYDPWPLEGRDFARTSEQQPTPKLTVANLDGRISQLCMQLEDMVGTIVKRKRTFVKFLDGANFPPLRNLLANSSFIDSTSATAVPMRYVTSASTTFAVSYTTPAFGAGRGVRLFNAGADGGAYIGIELQAVDRPAIEAGKRYVNSVYARGKTGQRMDMYIQYLSSTGNGIGPNNGVTQVPFTLTGTYQRYQIVGPVAPVGAVAARAFSRAHNSGTVADLDITLSNAQFEEGTVATDYVFTSQDIVASRNPDADPNEQMPPEVWYIERKSSETRESVSFELVSAFDLEGVKLPRRQVIANYCTWKSVGGYRGVYCGYTGVPVAEADGTPTTDPGKDSCGGKLSDCRLRQWPDKVLNFGGFPAAGLMRT